MARTEKNTGRKDFVNKPGYKSPKTGRESYVSPEMAKKLKEVYYDRKVPYIKRMAKVMKMLGVTSERFARKKLKMVGACGDRNEPAQYLDAQKRKFKKSSKRFIITWAQNNTPVHKEFLKNIKAYAKFIDADIHVILGRYRNPTSIWSQYNEAEEVWDPLVLPYADANRHDIHDKLCILSDIKIPPTASMPMSGLESVSGTKSCVFGSPRVHLKVIPALEGYDPKFMFTTGSVTEKNYTDSKSGKKGDFHHTYGFCIVEIQNKDFFCARQVTADKDGSFYDLAYYVDNCKVKKVDSIEAAVLGDIHVGDNDEKINAIQRSWLDKLKPKHTVLHDVFNGHSINPHEADDPIKQYERFRNGSNMVKKEIDAVMDYIQSMLKYNIVIPPANHNDFIDRWIKKADWKKGVHNAPEYLEYTNILLSGKAPHGLIEYLIRERFGNKVKTLGRNSSFSVNGFELATHGDVGANGSRGGIMQFKRMNTKMVIGHTHTVAREDGVLYVGTSTKLRVGYNIGASSWTNGDVIIHKDGKAQHILYFNGKFTTLKF